ncbi:hypothetical protein P1T79_22410, partial [Escherichia coli]|nr:hypothetical protein [Escherichia coli]
MLVLKSQSIGFRISTTYLSLTYTESDGVNIKVDALELISTEKDYVQIELVFTTVAEVKEGANKRGNSSRLTQSFHFFMFEPI